MSVKCIPHYTPLLYSKVGIYRGIPSFLIFASKHRLWVHVKTALSRQTLICTHSICLEQFFFKSIKFFPMKLLFYS